MFTMIWGLVIIISPFGVFSSTYMIDFWSSYNYADIWQIVAIDYYTFTFYDFGPSFLVWHFSFWNWIITESKKLWGVVGGGLGRSQRNCEGWLVGVWEGLKWDWSHWFWTLSHQYPTRSHSRKMPYIFAEEKEQEQIIWKREIFFLRWKKKRRPNRGDTCHCQRCRQ